MPSRRTGKELSAKELRKRRFDDHRIDRFSPEDDALLLRSFSKHCHDKGIDEEELKASWRMDCQYKEEKALAKKLCKVCGWSFRHSQAIWERLKRLTSETGRRWSREDTKRLKEIVAQYNSERVNWTAVGRSLGRSSKQCREKYRYLTGGRGRWSKEELRALRYGIQQETGRAVPLRDVPWVRVGKHVITRNPQQCRMMWYRELLPELLEYKDDDGNRIEPDVFCRAFLRRLVLARADHDTDVDWNSVNPWWPAIVTRGKWWQLQMTLPDPLLNAPPGDQALWCHKALQCKKKAKRDARLLLQAKLVEDIPADAPMSLNEESIMPEKSFTRRRRGRRKEGNKRARAKRSIRSSIDVAGLPTSDEPMPSALGVGQYGSVLDEGMD